MKEAERKRKILYHQHLTSRCDAQTAARDVLALQAQFLRHAQMSLRLRTRDDSWKQWVKQSVKTRAFRGTLHLLDAEDRLLITSALWKDYEHRKYYMARYYTPQEEQLFCNAILDLLQQGICGRREIYTRLVAMGLDEKLCELACSSWDGLFAVLNIQGKVMFQHAASREFAYAPISLRSDLDACRKELVYRYLICVGIPRFVNLVKVLTQQLLLWIDLRKSYTDNDRTDQLFPLQVYSFRKHAA